MENQKIVDKVEDRKVVNKKPSNLIRVLKRKTSMLYIKLQLRGIGLKRLRLKLKK